MSPHSLTPSKDIATRALVSKLSFSNSSTCTSNTPSMSPCEMRALWEPEPEDGKWSDALPSFLWCSLSCCVQWAKPRDLHGHCGDDISGKVMFSEVPEMVFTLLHMHWKMLQTRHSRHKFLIMAHIGCDSTAEDYGNFHSWRICWLVTVREEEEGSRTQQETYLMPGCFSMDFLLGCNDSVNLSETHDTCVGVVITEFASDCTRSLFKI